MPPRIALVTYGELPKLAEDDRPLIPALARHGYEAVPAVWNDPALNWSGFTAAVIRSTWDYHHDLPGFLRWVDHLDRAGVRVFNPPAVLRWNSDKRYLDELEASGIPVVPTRWVETGGISLLDVLDERGWEHAVVKPAVSASGFETWKVARVDASEHEARFRRLVSRGTVMVQPYIDQVAREGEWSLLYIGGEFSHALVKRARPGEFRVQDRHGGTAHAKTPSAALLSQAGAVLRAALPDPSIALYARVDGCVVDGRFLLMEIELLEPTLFFRLQPGAPERMAAALAVRL
jgi:glutathione synthase/RimK-type ligase-like ATP-grasp enzyme